MFEEIMIMAKKGNDDVVTYLSGIACRRSIRARVERRGWRREFGIQAPCLSNITSIDCSVCFYAAKIQGSDVVVIVERLPGLLFMSHTNIRNGIQSALCNK